jgi:hypothetical protein
LLQQIDEMAAGESTRAGDENVSQRSGRFKANGGHVWSRGERVGEAGGRSMANVKGMAAQSVW